MHWNEELCEFLMGGVSITLASRSAQLIPSIARAKGCIAVSDGAAQLRIFVSAAQAAELIDDVRASAMVSATFSVPTTHRTLQFKGGNARVTTVRDAERALIEAYVGKFAAALRPLGFSDDFTRAFLASPADEVAIEFTPSEGFQQTPGPSAGARLA